MNTAEDAIHVIIPIFCVATMFAMGLDVTLAEAVAPLRQMLALGITVLVNNVLIPLLGFLVIALPALLAADWLANLGLEDLALTGGAQMGFLLLMLASGSLLGPTLARIAGANEATAKGVMVMLAVASAVLVPVELQLLCSSSAIKACGLFRAVDTGSMFMLLLLFQLLPLAVGIATKARYDAVAVRLRPLIMQLMGLTLLVLLALLFMSRYQVAQWPGEVAIATPELAQIDAGTPDVTASTYALSEGNVKALFAQAHVSPTTAWRTEKLPVNGLTISSKEDTPTWVVVPISNTYTLEHYGDKLKITGPEELLSVATMSKYPDSSPTITGLNKGMISSSLRDDYAKQHFMLPSDLAVALTGKWLLTNSNMTYVVVGKNAADASGSSTNGSLYLHGLTLSPLPSPQTGTQPTGVVGVILTFLGGIPIVDEIVSFLAQFVVMLLPYALLAALVALLLLIGKYTGVAVRNLVGVTGEEIPRAMAISTAVRNVSIGLLLANEYYSLDVDSGAIAVLLVFYVVSLIVTAHEAVQWGKEAVQMTTAQGQPIVAAEVASTPAV